MEEAGGAFGGAGTGAGGVAGEHRGLRPKPLRRGSARGPEELKRWIGVSLAAFADQRFTVAVRWVFRAWYRGGIPGASPDCVGRRAKYAGIDILRVGSGKIAECWLRAHVLRMLRQVGAIPP